ncbi:MAG: ribonuclease HI [Henriciella sp.]|nr:ribonuclease HI [Henriciella sp.]
MSLPKITLYTDGACSPNPGIGGWGVVFRSQGRLLEEISGRDEETTNNRMELRGAIEALNALKKNSSVTLHTDSTYVKDGLTKWIHGWKRNGWKTSAKKPVKNKDLWQALETACEQHEIEWVWVKGHSGDEGNEIADELARKGCEAARRR